MPKRRNEEEIELLARRLKQLKKDVKNARRKKRSSSSSSASTCSTCSSSRSSSPAPEYPNDRDATAQPAQACDDAPPPPPTQVAGRPNEAGHGVETVEPVAGSSHRVEPVAGPSHRLEPVAGPSHRPEPVAGPSHRPEPVAGPSHQLEPVAGPSHELMPVAGASHAMPLCANLPTIEIEDDDNICQAVIMDILGADPSQIQKLGEEINKDVASRFEGIASSGLDKQARQELLDKFLVPSNCMKIDAPKLNAEIKSASTEAVVKRDKAIELRQKQVAAAITGVGRILTSQLKAKDKDNTILKQLMDVGRLLCDIQHCESSTRRNFTLYSLKKDFRDQLANTKIDTYLFGEDLSETLKTAKAVSKSSMDIKMDQQKLKQTPSKFTRNLNWKTGPSARNQTKGPTQKNQSAASSSRRYGHRNSSHRSSHRAKHTHRR